nr:nicotinamide-nucleotide amidohydrolase family protein [Nesterenkonia populi]
MELVQRCAHRGLTIATAESLTAGSLAARIADVPGASAVLLGGVVSYSVGVKEEVLEVPGSLLEERGAVDGEVAACMARGAARRCRTDIGIATTGVAGPASHDGKDVGTVYLGAAVTKDAVARLGITLPPDSAPHQIDADWVTGSILLDLAPDAEDVDDMRAHIRSASVEGALKVLYDLLLTEPAGMTGSQEG